MAKQQSVATTFKMADQRRRGTGTRLEGKTIVQILPAMERGGVERGTVEVAEAVINEGGRAVVISNGGQLASRLQHIGAEHVELPVHTKNPLLWPLIRNRVGKELGLRGADLVHIRSRAPAWIAIPAARRLGLPVVTTIHGRIRPVNAAKRYYNSVMMRGDRVIAISRYIQGLLLEQHPELAERLTVIPRGVDLGVFAPDLVSASRVIKMSALLDLPDDRPVIMLPARPSDWKGADLLIEAARLIRDIDFLMVLVGAGDGSQDYQQGLIARIRDNGLDSRVRLSGGVGDMAAALMLADVVAMPSKSPEPFGRGAIAASAMGCPVVAFNHGGAAESIQHGVTGWLAEPVDVGSLATCLREALGLKARERLLLSKNAREFVAANFTSARMCERTIGVYEEMVG